jgi:hypothetical protein
MLLALVVFQGRTASHMKKIAPKTNMAFPPVLTNENKPKTIPIKNQDNRKNNITGLR